MPVELRPGWCLTDEAVTEVLAIDEWTMSDGRRAFDLDGDSWAPGETLTLTRGIGVTSDLTVLRRRFGILPGQVLGVACRWSCRRASTAGVHRGGPSPVALNDNATMTLEVPAEIAGSIEIETCLVVTSTTDDLPAEACPDGALVWSDGWTMGIGQRTILLEGDEARIPVRTAAFDEYFGQPSGALWAVEVDTSTAPDDLLANVVTVLLNREVLQRDFCGDDGEPDATRIPASALAGISVDLVRSLTAQLRDDFEDVDNWADLPDGSVGAMLVLRLTQAFGAVGAALADYEHDQSKFSRELWNCFAPDSWSSAR